MRYHEKKKILALLESQSTLKDLNWKWHPCGIVSEWFAVVDSVNFKMLRELAQIEGHGALCVQIDPNTLETVKISVF